MYLSIFVVCVLLLLVCFFRAGGFVVLTVGNLVFRIVVVNIWFICDSWCLLMFGLNFNCLVSFMSLILLQLWLGCLVMCCWGGCGCEVSMFVLLIDLQYCMLVDNVFSLGCVWCICLLAYGGSRVLLLAVVVFGSVSLPVVLLVYWFA